MIRCIRNKAKSFKHPWWWWWWWWWWYLSPIQSTEMPWRVASAFGLSSWELWKAGWNDMERALSWTRRWKIICHMSGCRIHHVLWNNMCRRESTFQFSMSVWLCAFIMKALVKHFESNSTLFLFCWGFSDGTAAGRSGRSCWKVQIVLGWNLKKEMVAAS